MSSVSWGGSAGDKHTLHYIYTVNVFGRINFAHSIWCENVRRNLVINAARVFCCCCWLKSRALIQHDSQRKTPVAWSLTDYWLPFSSHQTEQNSKNRTNNRQESYPTVPTKQPHNECAERPHVMEYMGQPSVTMTMLMIISDVCDQRQRGDWLFFRLSRSHALLLYSVIIVDNTINEQPNHEWDKSKATKQSTIFRRHFLLRFFV